MIYRFSIALFFILITVLIYDLVGYNKTSAKKNVLVIVTPDPNIKGVNTKLIIEIKHAVDNAVTGKTKPDSMCEKINNTTIGSIIEELKTVEHESDIKPRIAGNTSKIIIATTAVCEDGKVSEEELEKVKELYK